MPTRPLLRLASFASLCGALLAGCSGADGGPPSVILITLDTLRADHLSCYGYGEVTSPRIDAFALRATRYDRCLSTAPWTVPSHASLFTGRHPFEHGAVSFDVDHVADNVHPLSPDQVTLAEVLHQEGYATAGFVANAIYLHPRYRLNQGFETWVSTEPWRGQAVSPGWAHEINARAFRWLEEQRERDPDQPFLLFLNYLDTHRPYNVTPAAGEAPYPPEEHPFQLLDRLYDRVVIHGGEPGELGETVIAQYDRSIRNLDVEIGRLLDHLEEEDLFDDALIVITSDHGEYFGEHGLVEHSKDIYQEALEIPLILKAPGQRTGQVREELASLVDVPGLILAELSEDLARRHAAVFPYLPGQHPVLAENYFSRPRDLLHPALGDRFRRSRVALFDQGFKYIHSSDAQHELYQLADDPAETENQIARRPKVAARLSAQLAKIAKGARARTGEARALTPDEREAMEAFGYAGGDEETKETEDR